MTPPFIPQLEHLADACAALAKAYKFRKSQPQPIEPLHAEACAAAQAVADLWYQQMPKHWKLPKPKLEIFNNGKTLLWIVQPRTDHRIQITATLQSLLYAQSFLLAWATHPIRFQTSKDLRLFKNLHLDPTRTHNFHLSFCDSQSSRPKQFLAPGKTPLDAYARLLVCGAHLPLITYPGNKEDTPSMVKEKGTKNAAFTLNRLYNWHGQYAVFQTLMRYPSFSKLFEANWGTTQKDLHQFIAFKRPDEFWNTLRRAYQTTLLKTDTLQPFMVTDSLSQVWIGKAYCPDSAYLCRRIASVLFDTALNVYPKNWTVYPYEKTQESTICLDL